MFAEAETFLVRQLMDRGLLSQQDLLALDLPPVPKAGQVDPRLVCGTRHHAYLLA